MKRIQQEQNSEENQNQQHQNDVEQQIEIISMVKNDAENNKEKQKRWYYKFKYVLLASLVCIVIVIGVGIGLAIGLSRRNEPTSSTHSSSSSTTASDPVSTFSPSITTSTSTPTTVNPTTTVPSTNKPTTSMPTTPEQTTIIPTTPRTTTSNPTLPPLSMSTWIQVGDDIDGVNEGDLSGYSVSMSALGDLVLVGAPGGGSAQVYSLDTSSADNKKWNLFGASLKMGEGDFGKAVSMSNDGTVIAISAPGESSNTGSVYMYNVDITTNTIEFVEELSGDNVNDNYGTSVAVSGDGNTVAVGALGYVQVHHKDDNNNNWSQLGNTITETTSTSSENWKAFGEAVSMSDNGNIVAVGAPSNRLVGAKVYHYDKSSNLWNYYGINNDDIFFGDRNDDGFGEALSLSSSGNIVAIGASWHETYDERWSGMVKVLRINTNTSKWEQIGSDIYGKNVGDFSGAYQGVKLSDDGMIVAIGSWRNRIVRIYQYDSINNVWMQISQDIRGEAVRDWSGKSISLSGDGSIVAIGAKNNDGINGKDSGHVRVYRRGNSNETTSLMTIANIPTTTPLSTTNIPTTTPEPTTPITSTNNPKPNVPPPIISSWEQVGNDIDGLNSNGDTRTSFSSVSISSIGDIVVVGSHSAGITQVYELNTKKNKWKLVDKSIIGASGVVTNTTDNNNSSGGGGSFGWAVSTSTDGTLIAIGAPNQNNDTGSAYLYNLKKTTNTIEFVHKFDGDYTHDFFGISIDVSSDGRTVAVGAPFSVGEPWSVSSAPWYGTNGYVKVFQKDNNNNNSNETIWIQVGNVIGGVSSAEGDEFGRSVSMSNDGNVLAVGAPQRFATVATAADDDNDDDYDASGYVKIYQYKKSDNTWEDYGNNNNDVLVGDSKSGDSGFGSSVSLSLSGNIVAIGAPYSSSSDDGIKNVDDDDNKQKCGTVKVFQLNPTTNNWEQLGNNIYGEGKGDRSGIHQGVKLSDDGMIVAIGSYKNDGNNNDNNENEKNVDSGSVRIFEYYHANNEWIQISQDIDGKDKYSESGRSISLSGDGSIVAIGSGNIYCKDCGNYVRVYHRRGGRKRVKE